MENIKIINTETLADHRYKLNKVTFQFEHGGKVVEQTREVYQSGNGITILLYNRIKKTVILTKQFRIATFLNGNRTGMLTEACAGLLENEDPDTGIRRETEEETGYKVNDIQNIFEAYMSAGSVTEMLHFYIAEYSDEMKVNRGGGLEEEQENIEVIEMDFNVALNLVKTGEIKDAKTIMLLQYIKLHNLIT